MIFLKVSALCLIFFFFFFVWHYKTSEIASPELRGIIASLPAVFGVAGILCTYILGTFMDWRTMTLVELVIPVSYLSMLFHVESPVWLLQKGKIDIARKAIKSLRGRLVERFFLFIHMSNKAKVIFIHQQN